MKKIRLISLMLVIMLIGACAFAQPLPASQVGEPALDFTLKMLDGEIFRLSEQRGKVVFLNIWATWCGPCVMEMPFIDELAKNYPDELVVLGVSCDENEEIVKAFVEQQGYSYNFAWDGNYLVSGLLYPSYAIPNSVFIDPNGVVTSIQSGSASYEMLEQRLLDALNAAKDPE